MEKLQEIMAEVAEHMKPENTVVKWTVHPDRYVQLLKTMLIDEAPVAGWKRGLELEKSEWIPKNRIIQHYADGHISILETE